MRGIFFVCVLIPTLLPAVSTEAVSAGLSTGFVPGAGPGQYWAMSSSYRSSFGPEGIALMRRGHRAVIRFPGAKLAWRAEGEGGAIVHFLGDTARSFAGGQVLRAAEAYPGVDVVVRIHGGRLKSEFQLAPGVPYPAVGYCLEGAAVRASADGQDLTIDAGGGWSWREEGLASWQDSPEGEQIPRKSRFVVADGCVRFQVDEVDPSLPLTIDPELAFSSYLGGGMFDAITAVASDSAGNLYLGGWTESSDFPALNGLQPLSGGRIDGFVAKVNPSGQLLFSTYLGGTNEDRVQAIVVDGAGVITVAGLTNSLNFPMLNPARGALSGGRDAFVTRLYPAGNQLVFSTYWGGTAHDAALAIALDFSGNVVVGGETASTDFPTLAALSATSGGGVDGFLARFTPAGAVLSSTYLGGGADDRVRGVAVRGDGTLHLTGSTASSNFPVLAANYPTLGGSMDAFYMRLNTNASAISQSTYLGGSGGSSLSEEAGYGVTIDTLGRTWIAGATPSADFPGVAGGFQSIHGGGGCDGFVAVFTSSGSLEWATYLGGGGLDAATSISAGSGYVGLAGYTTSNNLPVAGALQTARAGEYDAFWAAFPIASNTPLYVSYLGGAGSDSALAVSAFGGGLAVAGSTLSSNFPLQTAVQSSNPGSYGGFVSRFRFGPGPIAVSPSSGSGLSKVFTFTIAHANGAAGIQNAAFLFNAGFSFANGCYVYFDRGPNLVSLYKDAGAAWLNLTPGAATTVDNGACAISGTGLTVSTTANSLVVTLPVTFNTPLNGSLSVYANANDVNSLGAGWPQVGTWIAAAQAAPIPGSVNPASGSGSAQTFAFTFSDANGAADIATASVFINNVFSTSNGCYFTYDRVANTISLFRDSDSAFLPVTPGVSGTVSNANCSISGAGAAVNAAGSLLTVTVPITFLAGFTGARTVYAAATDAGGLGGSWQQVGTWTAFPVYTPAVVSVSPASGGGLNQTFTFTLSDGNGYTDIAFAGFLVQNAVNTANGCYITYAAGTNTFAIYRDSDSSFLPIVPGSGSSVENGNCRVSGNGLAVSGTGTLFSASIPINFKTGFAGTKNIYASVADAGGLASGWQAIGTWDPVPSYSPTVVSLQPAAGSGLTQTFTFHYSDANGNADISAITVLFNTSLNSANGCYLTYSRGANALSLFRDSDSSWMSIAPGGAGIIENTKCSIAGASFATSTSGNSFHLSVPVTFKSGFAAPLTVYTSATDQAGLSSGWIAAGSWTSIGPTAPTVVSLTPNSGSASAQTFSIVLSDANGNADISSALLLVNSTLNGSNGCFIWYNRSVNAFFLFRDSDTVWQVIYPGASTSVSNPNCTVSGAALATAANGNTLTLTLPLSFGSGFTGQKSVYVSVSDAGGLSSDWVTAGTWSPGQAPAPPTVTSVSPSSGSGLSQTFSVTLSDANGNADIASALIVINAAITGQNSCYLSFNRAANVFYLFADANNTWQPVYPGSSTTVSNPNCSLSGSGLSTSASGNSVILTMPMSFSPSYAGAKNFYVYATDAGGLASGWVTGGSWSTAQPVPPALVSVSPSSGSGASQLFTVTISDANGNADISSALILINTTINGQNACFLSFNRSANVYYLLRDSDGVWQPVYPGTQASVTNGNCTLTGAALATSASGNNLVLQLPLSFSTSFSGTRNFYVSAADAGGLSSGWAAGGTWNAAAPAAPTVTSVTPASGAGSSQNFTVTFNDLNGHADIASALLVVNSSLTGQNSCYLSYNRSVNAFYLYRDSDNLWQVIYPGGSTPVTNNNCSLSGTGLASAGSGNSFTLTLPLSFKPGFAGAKNFYAYAADSTGLASGMVTAGTWTVN